MEYLKKLIVIIFLVAVSKMIAQDAIVNNDKSVIKCKITEISDDFIYYTRSETMDKSFSVNREAIYTMVFNDGNFEKIKQDKSPQNPSNNVNIIYQSKQIEGVGMSFENETIDYGTIPHNADGKREFVFVNNGNKPLRIMATKSSCGCTIPSKPEGDIAPGEKGVIGVTYATDRVGAFTKTITIKSNATSQETKVVTIKGTVLAN